MKTFTTNGFLLLLLAGKTLAQSMTFNIETGVEYDSNVSVNELDQNTAEGDVARLVDLGIGFEYDFSDATRLKLGFDYSDSRKTDFPEYDLQFQHSTARISHKIASYSAEVSYIYAASKLAGDRFLTLHRISPAMSKLAGRRFYLRGQYDYTEKFFPGREQRDAESDAYGGMVYYFINRTITYISGSYTYVEEFANDPQYNYDSDILRLGLSHDFDHDDLNLEMRIGLRYEHRYYSSITPLINAQREDERRRYSLEFKLPLGEYTYGLLELGYDDYKSNLSTADYIQYVYAFSIGAEF